MEGFGPPQLERRFACVVPDNNPVVGALVSTYFNTEHHYFPVFTFPNVDKPFTNIIDHTQDGYPSYSLLSSFLLRLLNG
jgi:hypothetical protein